MSLNRKIPDDESSLDGYASCYVHIYRDDDVQMLKLFLPTNGKTTRLVKDLQEQAEAAHEEASRKRRIQTLERLDGETRMVTPESAAARTPFKRVDQLDIDAERQSLRNTSLSDAISKELTHVPVYHWDEPLKLIEGKFATPDSDVHKRGIEIFKRLKAKGHLRMIAKPFDPQEVLCQLELLRSSQPHFADVVDLVQRQIALAEARGLPLKLPPILLNGDPGVGKTFFTHALADALGAPMRRHAFDAAMTEAGLTGSDRQWGNTTYGLVFEIVCLGDAANPIVLLDELDKASQTFNRNPIAPLHTLLEPETSHRVTDISVGLTFDCSYVSWIATANNPARIPASIRSRFLEFDIQLPTGLHALQVARGVADAIYGEMALPDFEPVSPQIVKLIAYMVPREQGQVLRRAFASAVANQRTSLQREDLPLEVLQSDDEAAAKDTGKQKFLH